MLDIPGQEIITKDNAMVGVDAVVFFQVLDAAKAAYEVSDLYVAIMQITTTSTTSARRNPPTSNLPLPPHHSKTSLGRRRPPPSGIAPQ